MKMRLFPLLCGVLASLATMLDIDSVSAQALPAPQQFISQLDLSCYQVGPNSQVDLNFTLQLTHLNPLIANLPPHTATMRRLQELCVPVAKNNVLPDTPTLQFIQFVDLACYELQNAPPLNRQLDLNHLNPVVRQLLSPTGAPITPERVAVFDAVKLCVPVAKIPPAGGPNIPPAVLNLIQNIDLECYRIQANPIFLPLQLRHLNPILTQLPTQALDSQITPAELCVPVFKNNVAPPADVRPIIQVIDIKKYTVGQTVTPLTVNFQLMNLNPLLAPAPVVPVTQLLGPLRIGLPVEKIAPQNVPIMPWQAAVLLCALVLATAFTVLRRSRRTNS